MAWKFVLKFENGSEDVSSELYKTMKQCIDAAVKREKDYKEGNADLPVEFDGGEIKISVIETE